ncbi:hypothetical protein [Streptomyces sp. DH12]|uniref:hypothetical protein n=1 Tax=Streptomyces sp. DH12 TaxID=2857010 RepID=UPI001E3A7EAA|nr:hypothetical protein [Streptomyces sp. DH12]
MTTDPLTVTTLNGVVWERRAETADGRGLYTCAGVRDCPAFVMATLSDLTVHGLRPTPPPPALAAEAPGPAPTQQDPLNDRLATLEKERAGLLALLPRDACITEGTPNALAAAEAEYGAWELVAGVLGVTLPYASSEPPIPFALTEAGERAAAIERAAARLRAVFDMPASGGEDL